MAFSWLLSGLMAVGLLLTWVGERVLEAGTGRLAATGLGVALVVVALAVRAVRSRSLKSQGERGLQASKVEGALLGLQLVVLAALAMYFAQSDVLVKLDGALLESSSPKLAGALAAVWPAVLLTGLLPTLLMEISWAAMTRAPTIEAARVRDAMYSGLGLAAVLTFAFALQYVVTQRDVKKDFAYFRTAKAGEATKKLVASFDGPVEVSLFFPPASEVADQLETYFEELAKESSQLKVARYDHALEPKKAKEVGASGNGVVVVSKGARHESYYVGTELEKARMQLRGIDLEVQKRLKQVAKSQRTIYLTRGHGERGDDTFGSGPQRAAVELLRNELKGQNYELKTISAAEGLGSEIPKDAAAVLVLGPQQSFQAPEAKALFEYGERGGKLFFALDPEAGVSFEELLKPLGLKMAQVLLANDVSYARKSYTPADRTLIGSRKFSSHPSVSTNGRQSYPMFFMGAGPLEELEQHPADISIDFAVRAEDNTWNDLDGDFEPDEKSGEKRQAWGVGAAVTKRKPGSTKVEEELRALVLSDSDAVSDEVLSQSRGNAYFVLDGLKWLFGEEQLAGVTNSENDSPILTTRREEAVVFYASTFLVPSLVMGLGFALKRRAKRAARPEQKKEVTA